MKTRATIEIVDAIAMLQALESTGMCNHVEINYDDRIIYFTMSRYAMDGNGYHVGYEEFTGVFRLYSKRVFNITEMSPYGLSSYFIVPNALEVNEVIPAEQPRIYSKDDAIQYLIDHNKWSSWIPNYVNLLDHWTDDELLQEAYDKGMGDGDYFPPDVDFAYEELNYVLNEALDCLPAATFDSSNGTWSLGSHTWKVPSWGQID